MSASSDKTQRFTFVGSNLYRIHSNGVDPAQAPGLRTSQVLKPGTKILKPQDLAAAGVEVRAHEPRSFTRTAFNPQLEITPVREHGTTQDLKKNLEELESLHSRLRFMLKEIKEFID